MLSSSRKTSFLFSLCLLCVITSLVVSGLAGVRAAPPQQDDGGDEGDDGVGIDSTNFRLEANLTTNVVQGIEWVHGEDVTLYIDVPGGFPGEYEYVSTPVTVGVGGLVTFFPPLDLVPGTYLVMTDEITTKTHTMFNIRVTYLSEALDEVGGYTDPDPPSVYVTARTDDVAYAKFASVNAAGKWLANFKNYVDINPRSSFIVTQTDAEGDSTRLNWQVNPPPYNDRIFNPYPTVIPEIPFEDIINTISATYSPDFEPLFTACGQAAANASVWYKFSPAENGELTLDTFGSDYNTMIGVWAGYPGSTGTSIACNNNAGTSLQSRLTLTYTSGINYYIGVAQYGFPQMGGHLKLHATSFADVPGNHAMWRYVEGLYAMGITGGCTTTSPLKYCPNNTVTRQQMAVFLLRAKYGPDHIPPEAVGWFVDVPRLSDFAPWIEELYTLGITGGCSLSPFMYCPANGVTRAQMAIFLLRAKEGSAYTPPAATGIFTDVPVSNSYAPWIEELYSRGVTGGCSISPLNYCPNKGVTRAQMATFIDRMFGFPQLPAP